MNNAELKQSMHAKLLEFMRPLDLYNEIAARASYSTRYIRMYFQTDQIHPRIEKCTLDLLLELRQQSK